uniref:Phosphoglycolate phosphatase 1 n=1 Tax=Colaphellus bowringi TaxID=561076 RepID=A0A8G0VLT9_9CUCU|nr:phosphoglycolate phosphatase 1 [Colaphellus bowringi]
MKSLKNLAEVCQEEQYRFISSFDHVLTDMDGVIWLAYKPIPGAAECIASLKLHGKRINYVTNNGVSSVNSICRSLKRSGFNAEEEDIANPILSAISYLKKINFRGEIFAVGSQQFKDELWAADFQLASDPPQDIEESVHSLLENIADNDNVMAVIFNYDVNLTFIKLQKMLTYLKRKECLFIVAANDKVTPIGPLGPLIGNQYFLNAIQNISGRDPFYVAKPSEHYVQFVNEKFHITDPKRVLFIGDSIVEDMSTADIGGYQKLLVLTGSAKLEDINNWKYPTEYQPEYYVESLKVFNEILETVQKCQCIP